MSTSAPGRRLESRWPVVLAVLAVLFLLAMLPARVRLIPGWGPFVLTVVMLLPVIAVGLTRANAGWLRAERIITLLFFLISSVSAVATLAFLLRVMVNRSTEISGIELLSSSIAVWVTNVLVFSLLYWQMDRGGPDARANDAGVRPDWQFPQTGVPDDAPPGWRPGFVDYLFLGYSTATAFSPTDTLPLTSRAKLLMMVQSTISLVTIVMVAARAINILGS